MLHNNTLATINTSHASSKIHVFQRDNSKAGGISTNMRAGEETVNRNVTKEGTEELHHSHSKTQKKNMQSL